MEGDGGAGLEMCICGGGVEVVSSVVSTVSVVGSMVVSIASAGVVVVEDCAVIKEYKHNGR